MLTDQYSTRFPLGYRPGVAIIGCGSIVAEAHLPVYRQYGVPVIGLFDVDISRAIALSGQFGVARVYRSLDELLDDTAVHVVDIATHPDVRPGLISKALDAGKHIFAQKPLARDLNAARKILAESTLRRDCKVAVNQNARWAPPWRIADRLIHQGAIGEVQAITALQNTNFSYITGTIFDRDRHFAIFDYSIHWLDIIRCWMDDRSVSYVSARQYRVRDQPPSSLTPWGVWIEVRYYDGAVAMVRGVGNVQPAEAQGHPFWIHGTQGTLHGAVRHREYVEIERVDYVHRYETNGNWYIDGFAGAFAELLTSIIEDRQPYNSLEHNILTLQMTLLACASADAGGAPQYWTES